MTKRPTRAERDERIVAEAGPWFATTIDEGYNGETDVVTPASGAEDRYTACCALTRLANALHRARAKGK